MLLEILRAKRAPVSEFVDADAADAHSWQLRSVEFENGVQVRQFDCRICGEVLFR